MEKRPFKVAPNIVMSLIKAQCGTLAKAVAECIANSYDAGATSVRVSINRDGVTVVDDGRGFASRQQIEDWFEVFGFDHTGEAARKMGAFGIGRAQLWSFASTIWRTNTFAMTVDVKNSGLDYVLEEKLPEKKGVEIIGTFYERLTTHDLQVFERDIEDLVRYFHIPVFVNGELICKDPNKERWTHTTDDAWIRVNAKTRTLTLYNLGMKVSDIPSHHFGVGGVVVTKPGVKLAVNMARNSVLEADCKVWKRIKPFLRDQGDKATRNASLTEDQLTYMAKEFLASPDSDELADAKLFTDVRGGKFSVRTLRDRLRQRNDQLTIAPAKSSHGDYIEGHKLGVVLSDVVLERFGVDSLTKLINKLKSATRRSEHPWAWNWLKEAKVFDDISDFPASVNLDYILVKENELEPGEKIALSAIRKHAYLHYAIRQHTEPQSYTMRTIHAGASEVAEAWTDGKTFIAINRKILAQVAKTGLSGCLAATTLLAHEYLHDTDSANSHAHDLEFMEKYHEITCGGTGMDAMKAAQDIFKEFLKLARERKFKLSQSIVNFLTVAEQSEELAKAA